MSRIWKLIKGVWFYSWGHLFALFAYDKKYLKGKWFAGKMNGLCSIGWKWVVHDALGRMFQRNNRDAKFPVSQHCVVLNPENITFSPDDLNNFQGFGQYFQAIGKITIGKGSFIGPNVGIITSNHDPQDPDRHLEPKPVVIGEKCWIGMNSVILPGVSLGDGTVVGAGAVVTKSFDQGHCIVAGNPAVIIKTLTDNGGKT